MSRFRRLENLYRRRWRDETIAVTRHIADIARAIRALFEGFAQRGDLDAKANLFHEDVRPDLRDQRLLTDDPAGLFGKRDQDIERPGAQLDSFIPSQEQALRREEPVGSDRDGVLRRLLSRSSHLS